MSCITIYHNPSCGTSRNTLAMIRQSGVEPHIVEYLQNPPSRAELKALLKGMCMHVREVLRQKDTPYEALDLGNPQWTEEQLLDFVEQYPILLNRPIVVTPLGVRLCTDRPIHQRRWHCGGDTASSQSGVTGNRSASPVRRVVSAH